MWRNLPIPEPFVIALAAAGLLQILAPLSLLPSSVAWFVVGTILILTGLAVVTRAVSVAGDDNLEQPASLITDGPYAFSRNPMYLAWAAMVLGLAVLLNSLWLAAAALLASAYLHMVTIRKEEKELQRIFGAEYQAYRRRVRRWL